MEACFIHVGILEVDSLIHKLKRQLIVMSLAFPLLAGILVIVLLVLLTR